MASEIMSEAWAQAWSEALNASEGFRAAAAGWEGALAVAVRGEPKRGIEGRAVFLDLWHGMCRAARAAQPSDLEKARFILTADADTWVELLRGGLDPVPAVMSGRLELSKGSVMSLLPHVAAAKELVAVGRSVAATLPPGWPAA